MARGRMIDKRISKSNKLSELKSDRSRVLYFMIYPHLDQDGKFSGDPTEIKEDCCPRLKYSIQKIAESMVDLHNVGLLILYEENENPYIQYTKFDDFQIGMRKDRESPSKIPNPDIVRSKSGVTPALYLSLSLRLRKESNHKNTIEDIYFDFTEYSFKNIPEKLVSIWREAFPACDINHELKKMTSWLIANPEKKKKNYKRFINNWLSKQQDSGGTKKETKKLSKREQHMEDHKDEYSDFRN